MSMAICIMTRGKKTEATDYRVPLNRWPISLTTPCWFARLYLATQGVIPILIVRAFAGETPLSQSKFSMPVPRNYL